MCAWSGAGTATSRMPSMSATRAPDPAVVAQVANQLANLFIEENLRAREGQAEGTSEFITMQAADAKKKLDALETTIREYKSQHNGELPEQENALQGALNRLQMEQISNRDAEARAEESKADHGAHLEDRRGHRGAADEAARGARPRGRRGPGPSRRRDGAAAAAQEASEILQEQLDALTGALRRAASRREAAESRVGPGARLPRPASSRKIRRCAGGRGAGEQAPAPKRTRRCRIRSTWGRRANAPRCSSPRSHLLDKEIAAARPTSSGSSRNWPITRPSWATCRCASRSSNRSRAITMSPRSTITRCWKNRSRPRCPRTWSGGRSRSASRSSIRPTSRRGPPSPTGPSSSRWDRYSDSSAVIAGALGMELRKDRLLGEWELPEGVPVLARVPVIATSGAASGRGAEQAGGRDLGGGGGLAGGAGGGPAVSSGPGSDPCTSSISV